MSLFQQNQNRLSSPYLPPGGMPPPHGGPPPMTTTSEAEYNANLPREGLWLMAHGFERERSARMHRDVLPVEGQTLDLSMPKKRESKDAPANNQSSAQGGGTGGHVHGIPSYAPPPPAHSKGPVGKPDQYRNPPVSMEQMSSYPAGIRTPTPQYPPRSTPPSQNSRPPLGGSIMQGTPLNAPSATLPPSSMPSLQHVGRSDGLLRPALQGRDIGGSITQGTPIVVVKDASPSALPPHSGERHNEKGIPAYERASPLSYYKGVPGGQGQPQPPSQPSGARIPYPADQQLTNNRQQIIMNDYFTSQQMMDRAPPGRGERPREREPLPSHPSAPQNPQGSRPNDRVGPGPPPPPHVMYSYAPHSQMYMPKMAYMDAPHLGYLPPSTVPSPAPPHSQPPPLQQQQQQPPQQRQGVIQRTSSVPTSRPPESRPSPSPVALHSSQGRTSSPGGLLAPSGAHMGQRPPMSSASLSISPREHREVSSIYGHDAFASLVNAAAAQQALPVPDRDRRDREREKERDQRQHPPGSIPR